MSEYCNKCNKSLNYCFCKMPRPNVNYIKGGAQVEGKDILIISDVEGCSIASIVKKYMENNRDIKKFIVYILGDIMDSTISPDLQNEFNNIFIKELLTRKIKLVEQKYEAYNSILMEEQSEEKSEEKTAQLVALINTTGLELNNLNTQMTSINTLKLNDNVLSFRSHNIRNLLNIKKDDKCIVVLGNRDLMKLKACVMFKLQESQNFVDSILDDDKKFAINSISEYNNPRGIILPMTYKNFQKFKRCVKDTKFSFNISSCISNFLTYMGNREDKLYVGSDITLSTYHTFSDMFKFIFEIVGGNNLLYALIYEIITNYLLLLQIICYDKFDKLFEIIKINDQVKLILTSDIKEYFCYIIGFLLNKMFLNNQSVTTIDRDSISKKYLGIILQVGDLDFVDEYTSLDSLLYLFFTRSTTTIVNKIQPSASSSERKVYLLSHGGITKYCMRLYTSQQVSPESYYEQIYDRICCDIKGKKLFTIKDICAKIIDGDTPFPNFTADYINTFVQNCNNFFKTCIKDILENEKILCTNESSRTSNASVFNSMHAVKISQEKDKLTPFASLIYVLLMGTEIQSNKKLSELFELKYGSNNYLSPIGPGMSALSQWLDGNMKFNNNSNQLIQIMGHKPIGISPSFYKLPEEYNTTLVCTDTSNSFIGTNYNNVTNYSYVSITYEGVMTSYAKIDTSKFTRQQFSEFSLENLLNLKKYTIYADKSILADSTTSLVITLYNIPEKITTLFSDLSKPRNVKIYDISYVYSGQLQENNLHVVTIIIGRVVILIIDSIDGIVAKIKSINKLAEMIYTIKRKIKRKIKETPKKTIGIIAGSQWGITPKYALYNRKTLTYTDNKALFDQILSSIYSKLVDYRNKLCLVTGGMSPIQAYLNVFNNIKKVDDIKSYPIRIVNNIKIYPIQIVNLPTNSYFIDKIKNLFSSTESNSATAEINEHLDKTLENDIKLTELCVPDILVNLEEEIEYNTGKEIENIPFRNIAFANVCDAYILIGDYEGNSGTAKEFRVATANGKKVFIVNSVDAADLNELEKELKIWFRQPPTPQVGGSNSSFKQKYLKYKQKYLELTNKIR